MTSINLSKYVSNGLILRNIEENSLFDCVVYESFSNNELEKPKGVTCIDLTNTGGTGGIEGKLEAICAQYNNVLFVMESLSIKKILGFLEKQKKSKNKFCIINTATGVSSCIKKGSYEMHDTGLVELIGLSASDPSDVVSFFSLLENKGVTYIRLQQGEYVSSLFETPLKKSEHIISLTDQGFNGSIGTVIVGGRIAHEMLSIGLKLQEIDVMLDILIAPNRECKITDELRDSLLKTEHLTIVVDADPESIKNSIQSKLYEAGLYETEVHIITPDTKQVSTTQREYIYEQAGFDALALFHAFSPEE